MDAIIHFAEIKHEIVAIFSCLCTRKIVNASLRKLNIFLHFVALYC